MTFDIHKFTCLSYDLLGLEAQLLLLAKVYIISSYLYYLGKPVLALTSEIMYSIQHPGS